MINKGQDPNSGLQIRETFEDKKTDNKIRKHLTDINDVITEEDIKNVRTDFEPPATNEDEPPVNKRDAVNTSADDVNDTKDGEAIPVITPWDVLK